MTHLFLILHSLTSRIWLIEIDWKSKIDVDLRYKIKWHKIQNTYTMWVFGKSFILLLWNRTSLNLVLNARNDVFSVFSEEHLESSACHVSFQDDFPDFPYPLLYWHLLQCPALASWLSLKHKKNLFAIGALENTYEGVPLSNRIWLEELSLLQRTGHRNL